jgi:two-component system, NarL family, sensor histidine kinase UhpB
MKILIICYRNDCHTRLQALLKVAVPDAVLITSLSGYQGIEYAMAEDPDVIFLDNELPDLDGYEVCRILKQKSHIQDIPVVLFPPQSGSNESHIRALDAGAEAYIQQPFDETELADLVRVMVKIKSVNRHKVHEQGHLAQVVADRTNELELSYVATLNLLDDLKAENNARQKTEESLRRSRKEFQDYFNSASVGLSVTAPDKTLIEVNQRMCQIFGYKKEEIIGLSWEQISHPDDLYENQELFRRVLNGEIDNYELDKRFLRKDGSIVYVSLSTVCQRNEEGAVHHFLSSYLDITERKRSEEKILEYNDRLRRLTIHLDHVREDERISLARDLHDIVGSSLVSTKMELILMQHGVMEHHSEVPPGFQEQIQSISGMVDNTISLIRKLVTQLHPGVLEELGLSETVSWYSHEIEQRTGIDIKVMITPREIKMNVHQSLMLFLIYQEIMTNIIQHSKAQKVKVTIRQEDKMILLKVEDNGIGITPEQIQRTDSFGIMGMKERVTNLKGHIELIGEAGKGTIVSMEFPLE